MITIKGKGIPETMAWLKAVIQGTVKVSNEAIANYIVGDQSHGLMHEPYYKYVNRYAGFPGLSYTTKSGTVVPGYASAKQHRYVMAKIASGEIKPGQDNRTHDLTNSWKYEAKGNSYQITNDTPYAKYVLGNQQTRMHNLIGWRHWKEIIKSNLQGAYRYAKQQVTKYLAERRRR